MPERVHQIPAPIDSEDGAGIVAGAWIESGNSYPKPQHVEQQLGDQGHHHPGQHGTPGDLVEQNGALILGRRGRAQVWRGVVAAIAWRIRLVDGIRVGSHNVSLDDRALLKWAGN